MKNKSKNLNFENLTYEQFRELAQNNNLSKYEKIGFPDTYRAGKENLIFNDIYNKCQNLQKKNQKILDIGSGCSDLPLMFIDLAQKNMSELFLMDSQEMLRLLPDKEGVTKVPAFFPECDDFIVTHNNYFDVIIVYSVFHYIFNETNVYKFIDKSLSLLNNRGELLIGDIPNISMRKRFFSSDTGKVFHKKFMNTNEDPKIEFNIIEEKKIDDSVIIAVIMRARQQGFHAYILPQEENLPMSNRREDILIIKP